MLNQASQPSAQKTTLSPTSTPTNSTYRRSVTFTKTQGRALKYITAALNKTHRGKRLKTQDVIRLAIDEFIDRRTTDLNIPKTDAQTEELVDSILKRLLQELPPLIQQTSHPSGETALITEVLNDQQGSLNFTQQAVQQLAVYLLVTLNLESRMWELIFRSLFPNSTPPTPTRAELLD